MPHDVTEADRRAQAALYTNIGKPGMAEEILAGEMDDHPGVQAFAAHRIAAVAEVVAWLDTLDDRPFGLIQGDPPSAVVNEIKDSLRRGDHVGGG